MKFKTVIYVTKDNTPGINSFAQKKYDEQFNRIEGTVENEEEWNKFWLDVKTNMVDNIDTTPYFLAFVFNEAEDTVISFSPEDLSDDPDDMGFGSSYGKDWNWICTKEPIETKEDREQFESIMFSDDDNDEDYNDGGYTGED
jgi:hypothetical protein